jgi:hypothetical protein
MEEQEQNQSWAEQCYRRGVHQALAYAARYWCEDPATKAEIERAVKFARAIRGDHSEHPFLLDEICARLAGKKPSWFKAVLSAILFPNVVR